MRIPLKQTNLWMSLIVGIVLLIGIVSVMGRWPLIVPYLAVFRCMRWILTTVYACLPVCVAGYWLTRRLFPDSAQLSPMYRSLIAWTLGWALVILAGILLLSLGWYSVWVWIVLALGVNLAFLLWLLRQHWQPVSTFWRQTLPAVVADLVGDIRGSTKFLNISILLFLFLELLLALLPPDSADELTYHLVIPKLWAFQHDWWLPTDNYHLLFPANIEIIWGYALAIGGLHIPRLITLLFGLLCLGGMRRWLKDGGLTPGICDVSIFFFLISPLILALFTTNYVEWPLFLFLFLGWWASQQYLTTGGRSYLLVTVLSWGICAGTKYTAMVVIGLLAVEWLAQIARRFVFRKVIQAGVLLFVSGLIFAMPWLIRNYVLTRNPVYPLGQAFLVAHSLVDQTTAPEAEHLTGYVNLPGAWRWYPWLYHALRDRTTDHRMHPGWIVLHVVVLLFGWKMRRQKPWFTVWLLTIILFVFSPSPRIYFPLMGLLWLFLPEYLTMLTPRRVQRVVITVCLALFAVPALSINLYWFMAHNRASQDYLLGLVDDIGFLRKDGLLSPVMEWLQTESFTDSRVWLWCDYRAFYFDRWVRPSPAYEFPTFLTVLTTQGSQGLSQEIQKDRIDYIVLNTAHCPLPLRSVETEKMQWTISDETGKQLEDWMKTHTQLILQDPQFALYKVTGLSQELQE